MSHEPRDDSHDSCLESLTAKDEKIKVLEAKIEERTYWTKELWDTAQFKRAEAAESRVKVLEAERDEAFRGQLERQVVPLKAWESVLKERNAALSKLSVAEEALEKIQKRAMRDHHHNEDAGDECQDTCAELFYENVSYYALYVLRGKAA